MAPEPDLSARLKMRGQILIFAIAGRSVDLKMMKINRDDVFFTFFSLFFVPIPQVLAEYSEPRRSS